MFNEFSSIKVFRNLRWVFYYTYCVAWVNDETLYALATARLTLVSFSCALCCKKRGEKTRVKSIQYARKAVQIHKSKII